MQEIKLSALPKRNKYDIAKSTGYEVVEFDKGKSNRCYIVGADRFIDNDFSCIDDVLLYLADKLLSRGIRVA